MMKWVSERRFLHFIEDIKKLFAYKNELPTKLSQLENDIGQGTSGSISDEQIAEAVNKYLLENPIEVDLTDYVKNTDYPTSEVAGVVKVFGGNGVSCEKGQLAVVCATEQNIDERTQMSKPITPSNLDYAVRSALTFPKVAWSEDAKTLARQTLGIIDGDEVAY